MSNSNRHSPDQLQSQAHSLYLQHEYPQALQLYSEALTTPNLPPTTQFFLQTTISILHMHMHNYPQAYKRLSQLLPEVVRYRGQLGKGKGGDGEVMLCLLIQVKVCLLMVELVNCNEEDMGHHLRAMLELIDGVQDARERERLFRAAMLMMFGVASFSELTDQADLIVSSTSPDSPISPATPLLLTSLALTLQLLSNPLSAYQVQQKSYEAHRQSSQIIPQLLSLKHLIHLCDVLKYGNIREQYRGEFSRLMNMSEIYGISQQTLFRGYERKIEMGRGIVDGMMGLERGIGGRFGRGREQGDMEWLRKKVVLKLQRILYSMQNQSSNTPKGSQKQPQLPKTTLIRTLNTLNSKTGSQILSYMGNSPLVATIMREHEEDINWLAQCMGRVGLGVGWRVLVMLPPKVVEEEGHGLDQMANNSSGYHYRSNTATLTTNRYQQQLYRQQRYKRQYTTNPNPTPSLIPTTNPTQTSNLPYSTNPYISLNTDQLRYQAEREKEALREKEQEAEKRRLQEREREVVRQREMQRKQDEEQLREREARLREEERLLRLEREKYEEFRTRQDSQQNYITRRQETREDREYRERDISAEERDLSKQDRKYISVQQQVGQKKSRRKLQHASIIQKSPIRQSPHPSQPRQSPTQSRLKLQRTQKSPARPKAEHSTFRLNANDLNNSKIANHMNNVYLDSDSSRFVNPLEDLSIVDGQGNQGRQGRARAGVGSKVQRRNIGNRGEEKKEQGGKNEPPCEVMGILRSQNSRIKQTIRSIKKQQSINNNQGQNYNTQPNPQLQPNPNPSTHLLPNSTQNIIPQYQTTSPIRQHNPSPSASNIRNRNLDRSEEQVEFNNVDIIVQPAVNPNNVTNFTNVLDRTQLNSLIRQPNQQNLPNQPYQPYPPSQQSQPSPFILPPSIINQPQSQSQVPSNPQIRKIESSEYRKPRKYEPLTAKSPYIRRLMKLCTEGQYFVKRHYSSDGGEEKFVRLSEDIIKWAVDQDKINSKYQSYKLRDIKGITYGKVSDTFLKDCNKKLLPWLCFSLILQKRTLDFYCTDQIDPLIWLPGLTAALAGQTLTLKYPKKKDKIKNKEREAKTQQVPVSIFTPGRVLWKRFLMKLNQNYIRPLKKNQRTFKNANAYSIILWSKDNKRSKLKNEND